MSGHRVEASNVVTPPVVHTTDQTLGEELHRPGREAIGEGVVVAILRSAAEPGVEGRVVFEIVATGSDELGHGGAAVTEHDRLDCGQAVADLDHADALDAATVVLGTAARGVPASLQTAAEQHGGQGSRVHLGVGHLDEPQIRL